MDARRQLVVGDRGARHKRILGAAPNYRPEEWIDGDAVRGSHQRRQHRRCRRVAELVAEDPSLASSRDLGGVSAIMLSRYRFNRATTDALLAADPDLDVFEASALGYIDRLRERLMADPASATAFSPDGFTALHYAGFFGKLEAARELITAGASVDVYTKNPFAEPAAPRRGGGPPPGGLPLAAGGGRPRERHPAWRLHAVA